MADLHIELIQEILLGLPIKSVSQWLAVSKEWLKDIQSPLFSKLYLKRSMAADTSRSVMVSTIAPTPSQFYKIAFDDDDDEVIGDMRPIPQPLSHPTIRTQIVGHSNGLICICNEPEAEPSSDLDVWNARKDLKLALWNPTIQRFKRVPLLDTFTIATLTRLSYARYPPVYGFAFNSEMDDYEIIRIHQFRDAQTRTFTSDVRVYTLRSNQWRRIPGLPAVYKNFEVAPPGYSEARRTSRTFKCAFVNGHMNWLMEDVFDYSWKILAFDIKSEEFSDIELPEIGEVFLHIFLETLGGRLYLLEHLDDEIYVWRMDAYKDTSTWNCLYDLRNDRDYISRHFPLLISKTGRGTLCLFCSGQSWLFWYNERLRERDPNMWVLHLAIGAEIRATSFVQNFLLGDGDPVRHQ